MPENRTYLASRGVVIYLETSVEAQIARMVKDKKRPLLRDIHTRRDKLVKLMADREALYRELADYIFLTDRRSAKSVGDEILATLYSRR